MKRSLSKKHPEVDEMLARFHILHTLFEETGKEVSAAERVDAVFVSNPIITCKFDQTLTLKVMEKTLEKLKEYQ